MTHQPADRPRMAATYASGTVRARRWHGDGDVCGYPSAAWLDGPRRPDRSVSPHGPRFAARGVVDHRNQRKTSRTDPKPCPHGAGGRKLRAWRWPRPVSLLKTKTPHRRLRSGGDGAAHKRPCARNPRSQQVWRRIAPSTIQPSPAAMGGAGVATPRLAAAGCTKACRPRRWRFVVCTSRKTVHRHAAQPRFYGASAPRLSMWPRAEAGALWPCRRGFDLARVRAQAGAAVARGCPGRPCLLSGAGGLCVLVLL